MGGSGPSAWPEMGTGEGASLELAPLVPTPNLASPLQGQGREEVTPHYREKPLVHRTCLCKLETERPFFWQTQALPGQGQGAGLGHSLTHPPLQPYHRKTWQRSPHGETRLVPAAALRVDARRPRTGGGRVSGVKGCPEKVVGRSLPP